jgi:hypothetical protein
MAVVHSDVVNADDFNSGREQLEVMWSRPGLNFAGTSLALLHPNFITL